MSPLEIQPRGYTIVIRVFVNQIAPTSLTKALIQLSEVRRLISPVVA